VHFEGPACTTGNIIIFLEKHLDSGIIGTKEFVSRVYRNSKGYFSSRHEKRPKAVKGLDGIYSLKWLSEGTG